MRMPTNVEPAKLVTSDHTPLNTFPRTEPACITRNNTRNPFAVRASGLKRSMRNPGAASSFGSCETVENLLLALHLVAARTLRQLWPPPRLHLLRHRQCF